MVVAWWLIFAPFVVALWVRVPVRAIFHHTFNFSIDYHPKYKNPGFYFQTDLFNNFEIKNYLIFHLIAAVVLLTGLMDSCCIK